MPYDLEQIDRTVARFEDFEPWDEKIGVPTRDNCDLTNPRQMFLWMFTCMPGTNSAPLLMAGEYWEHQSFQMWRLGATLGADPVMKWQAPLNMVADRWQAAGKWVPLDEQEPERTSWGDVLENLSQADRAEIARETAKRLGVEGNLEIDPGPTLDEVATNLRVDVRELIAGFGAMGMHHVRTDRVDREMVDRVLVHMGLA